MGSERLPEHNGGDLLHASLSGHQAVAGGGGSTTMGVLRAMAVGGQMTQVQETMGE